MEERKVADQNLMADNQTFHTNPTVERSTHSRLPEDKVKSRDNTILPGKVISIPSLHAMLLCQHGFTCKKYAANGLFHTIFLRSLKMQILH